MFVVGDFNQGTPIPLHQVQDGAWRAVLDLPTGHQYHFRYLVNGEWRAEFQADGFATAEGLLTSVLNLTWVSLTERPSKDSAVVRCFLSWRKTGTG